MRRGKILEAEVRRSLNDLPGKVMVHRPDDMTIESSTGDRTTSFKPADFIFFWFDGENKHAGMIEAKEFSRTSFPFANIKEHQINSLKVMEDMGFTGALVIRRKGVRPVTAWYLPIGVYIKHKSKSKNKSSLTIAWLNKYATPLETYTDSNKRKYWKLENVIKETKNA